MLYRDTAIFSDLDGTLFNSDSVISEENLAAIRTYSEGGGLFAIATGRSFPNSVYYMKTFVPNAPSIVYNGSGVYDPKTQQYLYMVEVDREAILSVLLWCRENLPGLETQVYGERMTYYVTPRETATPMLVEQLMPCEFRSVEEIQGIPWFKTLHYGEPEETQALLQYLNESKLNERVEIVRAITGVPPYYEHIELLPKNITEVNFQAHYMEYLDRARMAMEWVYDRNDESFTHYNKEISDHFKRHMYVTRYINRAVEKRWLKVYYQPVIDVKTEKLLEYEALARWDDPAYGLLQPWQFIEPLEKANLVYKVDTFILAQYGRERQECMKRGEHLAPISFNLSRTDFYSCDIYSIVKDTMEQYEIPPDALHVEITESAVTRDLEQLKEAIRKFHDLGLEVWMDDFGSGYSNLNILK